MNELYTGRSDGLLLNGDFEDTDQTLTQLTYEHLMRIPEDRLLTLAWIDTARSLLPGFEFTERTEKFEYPTVSEKVSQVTRRLREIDPFTQHEERKDTSAEFLELVGRAINGSYTDEELFAIALRDQTKIARSLIDAGLNGISKTEKNELFAGLEHTFHHTSSYFKVSSPEGFEETAKVSWFVYGYKHNRELTMPNSMNRRQKLVHRATRTVIESPVLRVYTMPEVNSGHDLEPWFGGVRGYSLDARGKLVEIGGIATIDTEICNGKRVKRTNQYAVIEDSVVPRKYLSNMMSGIGSRYVHEGGYDVDRYVDLLSQLTQENMIVIPGNNKSVTKKELFELIDTAEFSKLVELKGLSDAHYAKILRDIRETRE